MRAYATHTLSTPGVCRNKLLTNNDFEKIQSVALDHIGLTWRAG